MSISGVEAHHTPQVKLCYICREEEHYDSACAILGLLPLLMIIADPSNPPVAWVHPCQCTLVAHESCLLNWVRSAQQDAARARNALKCPQCGAIYKIESDNPFVLRLLNNLNASISMAGKAVTVFGAVSVVVSCGFGTSYELVLARPPDSLCRAVYLAHVVRSVRCPGVLGEGNVRFIDTASSRTYSSRFLARYEVLLTDDPINWPWHAFLNLPLIPLSLILSRTRYFDSVPIYPLYLAWTTTPAQALLADNSRLSSMANYTVQPVLRWPPSPLMVALSMPFVTRLYRQLMTRMKHWLLGPQPTENLPLRRIELALNEGGPALHVRIAADLEPEDEHEHDDGAEAAEPAAGGAVEGEGGAQEERVEDPVAVAEQTVRVTGTSLGRFIGGALMIPKISNWMGSVLLSLSQRSTWLRKFLGVRPPLRFGRDWAGAGPLVGDIDWRRGSVLHQLGTNLRTLIGVLCGGTKVWVDADPVW